MYSYNVYLPHYFGEFGCITSECKDNCCKQSWKISIDKDTYDKFMRLDKTTRNEYRDRINVKSRNPFSAEIIPDEDGNCQFLDEIGRCSIHLKYGPEYLSGICMRYPRVFCDVDGEVEVFLHLSCEAVAGLVLFDQSIMRFEKAVLESDKPIDISYRLNMKKYTSARNAIEVFWKLRTVSIVITQSRQYEFHIRLKYLCLFVRLADELLASGQGESLSDFADQFIEGLSAGTFDDVVEQYNSGMDIDIEFIANIYDQFEKKEFKLLNKYISNAREGLGLSRDVSKLNNSFFEDMDSNYKLYFADKEYIFENLVVSHIFATGFPFNYVYKDSIVKNYRELIILFDLIKSLLVGVSKCNDGISDEQIVECVSSFLKVYDHRKHVGSMLEK